MADIDNQRMSQFLTTEHSTLQGVRSATILEANGRLGSFLSVVGSGIVTLALVAQVSRTGQIFLMFSIIIFPIMIFLGLTTMSRLVQVGISEILLVQAINRKRHYYLESTPEAQRYFSYSQYDDPEAIRFSVLPFGLGNEQLSSAGTQVAVINSFLAAVFASILAAGLFSMHMVPAIIVGVVVLVVAFGMHVRYVIVQGKIFMEHVEIHFPTQE